MKIDLKSKSLAIEWFQIKITNQKNDFKSWFQIIWFKILPNTAYFAYTSAGVEILSIFDVSFRVPTDLEGQGVRESRPILLAVREVWWVISDYLVYDFYY